MPHTKNGVARPQKAWSASAAQAERVLAAGPVRRVGGGAGGSGPPIGS